MTGTIDGTLLHDAWIEERGAKATQLRMQVRTAGGKTANSAMDLGHRGEVEAARAGLDRLRAGLPVELAGTATPTGADTLNLKATWIGERAMPGEAPGRPLLGLGRPPAGRPAQGAAAGALGIIRKGAAGILDTSLHHHDGGPEHLAAVQQHVGSLMGAIKGGLEAAKGGFAKGAAPAPAKRPGRAPARGRGDLGR